MTDWIPDLTYLDFSHYEIRKTPKDLILDRMAREMDEFDNLPILGGPSPGYASESLANMNQAKMARMPTMKDRLELAVQQAERKLADAKRAKELFEKNPDLEELLNIMQRGHF